MNSGVNLEQIERKAYTSTFLDGFWDIYLGLLLLAVFSDPLFSYLGFSSAYIVPDLSIIQIALTVLAIVVLIAGKRFVTVPRMGVAKFGPERKSRLNRMRMSFLATLVLGVFFFFFYSWQILPPGLWIGASLPLVLWITVCLGGFSLCAYMLSFNRLYFYGVLFAASFPSYVLLNKAGLQVLAFSIITVSGGIMMGIGLVLLSSFLRKYPVPCEEMPRVEC